MLNLFLEDLFLVIFCIFLFFYKLSIECQVSIIFNNNRGLLLIVLVNKLLFFGCITSLFNISNISFWMYLLTTQVSNKTTLGNNKEATLKLSIYIIRNKNNVVIVTSNYL